MRIACLLLWYERFYLQSSKKHKILSIFEISFIYSQKNKII